MFGLGRCKACEAKDAEILHLRQQQIKLEDRLMAMSNTLAPYEATRPDKETTPHEQIHIDEASGKIFRYVENLASWEEVTEQEQIDGYHKELEQRKAVQQLESVNDDWQRSRSQFIDAHVEDYLKSAKKELETQKA